MRFCLCPPQGSTWWALRGKDRRRRKRKLSELLPFSELRSKPFRWLSWPHVPKISHSCLQASTTTFLVSQTPGVMSSALYQGHAKSGIVVILWWAFQSSVRFKFQCRSGWSEIVTFTLRINRKERIGYFPCTVIESRQTSHWRRRKLTVAKY